MQAPIADQASILIIDDDPVQRRLSEAVLTRAGFAVRVAENGQAGLAAFGTAPASLIVLDMMMPGLDGAGVLEALMAGGNAPPVVVQTAQGSIDAAVRMDTGESPCGYCSGPSSSIPPFHAKA
ncbi:MAG: response regulator [Phyllobacteriaceae bacterium]|nr:response regulator [Phyllobacteriaceae bacterium]